MCGDRYSHGTKISYHSHLIHIDQLYPYHYMGSLFHTFLVGLFTFVMEDYQIPSIFIALLYYESYIYTNTYKPYINIY